MFVYNNFCVETPESHIGLPTIQLPFYDVI